MKLNEFTDRLYAMGGIKPDSSNKILNEDINNDQVIVLDDLEVSIEEDETPKTVVDELKRFGIKVLSIDKNDSPFTLWLKVRGTKIDFRNLFKSWHWEEDAKEIYPEVYDESLTEAKSLSQMKDYNPSMNDLHIRDKKLTNILDENGIFEEVIDGAVYDVSRKTALKIENVLTNAGYAFDTISHDDMYNIYINESLTEARNPENDEINYILKKWANGKRLSKIEKRLLLDRGYDDTIMYQSIYNRSTDRDLTRDDIKKLHSDADIAGILDKPKPSRLDKEEPVTIDTNTFKRRGHAAMTDKHGKPDGSKLSYNQFKSLQPYASEKSRIYDLKHIAPEWRLGYASYYNFDRDDSPDDIVNKAKELHKAKKLTDWKRTNNYNDKY